MNYIRRTNIYAYVQATHLLRSLVRASTGRRARSCRDLVKTRFRIDVSGSISPIYVYTNIWLYLFIYVNVYEYLHIYMHVCANVYTHVYVYWCVRVLCICKCTYTFMCRCTYMSMCPFIYASTCVGNYLYRLPRLAILLRCCNIHIKVNGSLCPMVRGNHILLG